MLRARETIDAMRPIASNHVCPESRSRQREMARAMSVPPKNSNATSDRCLICGVETPRELLSPRADIRCPQCGYLLCFRKRIVDDVIVLDAIRGRTTESDDMAALYRSTVWPGEFPRAVVNLREVDCVTSSFLAGLITLKKRLDEAGGTLVLYGLSPLLRDIFSRTKLDSFFDISARETEALDSLHAKVGCLTL